MSRQHSEHGASICKRWWNCPGSVLLTRGMPNVESEHARRGTAAHALAELCLKSGQLAEEYVDRAVILNDDNPQDTYPVDVAMADAVQVYLDECRGPMRPDMHDTFENMRAIHPDCAMIETQFDLSPLGPPAPMFGTCDFACYVPIWQTLFVKDYKNGVGVIVDAQGNPQLKYYSLGAMLALGPNRPVSKVEACIVQPNAPGRAPISRAVYDADELAEWSVELMERAAATLEPDAPLHAGEWCKFCPAAGTCAERARSNLAIAQSEFSDVPAVIGDTFKSPDPKLLTPAQLGGILTQAGDFEKWLADVRAAAFAALNRGEPIPGWKITLSRPNETWQDASAAAFDLQVDHGFAEADLMTAPELRSYAQIRDALAARIYAEAKAAKAADKAAPKVTKDAAREQARTALAPLAYRPPGKATLAPEDDARPAIPTNGDEFMQLSALTVSPESLSNG